MNLMILNEICKWYLATDDLILRPTRVYSTLLSSYSSSRPTFLRFTVSQCSVCKLSEKLKSIVDVAVPSRSLKLLHGVGVTVIGRFHLLSQNIIDDTCRQQRKTRRHIVKNSKQCY